MKFTQFALAAALLATASAQGLDALPDCAVCLSSLRRLGIARHDPKTRTQTDIRCQRRNLALLAPSLPTVASMSSASALTSLS